MLNFGRVGKRMFWSKRIPVLSNSTIFNIHHCSYKSWRSPTKHWRIFTIFLSGLGDSISSDRWRGWGEYRNPPPHWNLLFGSMVQVNNGGKISYLSKKTTIWVFPKIITPKSSILIGCSIINHPFCVPLFFGNIHFLPLSSMIMGESIL